MSHFIFLHSPLTFEEKTRHYRVRADKITWMVAIPGTETQGRYTAICVDGKELHVEEPPHVILTYIKDPIAKMIPEVDYEYFPCLINYKNKLGAEEGLRQYNEVMHMN